MRDPVIWLLVPAMVIFVGAISYSLAMAGEPQSAWLWYDVMGLCHER